MVDDQRRGRAVRATQRPPARRRHPPCDHGRRGSDPHRHARPPRRRHRNTTRRARRPRRHALPPTGRRPTPWRDRTPRVRRPARRRHRETARNERLRRARAHVLRRGLRRAPGPTRTRPVVVRRRRRGLAARPPEVADGSVGLVGASRGAEFALLLTAHCDWVGAVVSYAGSGVPWDIPSGEPAWTHDGVPVPHIEADEHPIVTDLDDRDLDGNVPPVENAGGPILLLSGQDDNIWNASRLSEVVVDRLDAHDFPHDYEHRTYDDCGHLIGTPYAPVAGIDDVDHAGGTPRGTVRASEDAWPAVLDTLEDGLKND
ncbi:acyl-CoA thioester hydrolase/BAAT C-terminal domain-containing protein [Halobacterium sp. KA-4]|uniref:acyl-CoA thioester hydrolase/BAAT C-terminal domain-containing protein n=1 Tax=Halobacterium sp. KA-4 TaxID=2896367 RepID=UPI003FA60A52